MRKSHGRYTNAKSAKRTALFLAVLFLALSAAAYRQFFQENPSFSAEELAVFDLRVRTCSLRSWPPALSRNFPLTFRSMQGKRM